MDTRPIGIFDSGVGGLTVLSAMARDLPGEDLIYLGDTARAPYGVKSKNTVLRYARQISWFLLQKDVKMIVVACNTATALTLKDLQKELPVPVLGVIDPVVTALEQTYQASHRKIGVIGTRSTIRSEAYLEAIGKKMPQSIVYQKACPLFVSLVEEGWAEKNVSRQVAHEYLDELVREQVELLILGCTHYPLLKPMLRQEFSSFELIDGSIETAKQVKTFIFEKYLQNNKKKGEVHIYITDLTDYFQTLEKLFFGGEISSVQNIQLPDE